MVLTHRLAAATALAITVVASPPSPAGAAVVTRNVQLMAQRNDYAYAPCDAGYAACWSYVHPDGREYAVIGVTDPCGPDNGVAIYNVTNPASPSLVKFIPGPQSLWREMKSYRTWIYVVTEGLGSGLGLQIIRMTNPDSAALVATYTTNFVSSHTVSVDTSRALLVCNGTKYDAGGGAFPYAGMRILSLANPEAPVELARWPGGSFDNSNYIHDSVPVGNRLYASSIYPGIQRVIDITNPAAPTQIASWAYAGGFTHNAWPDATGNWLYVTDEVNGEPLKIFDISNLGGPVLYNTYTPNPQAIVHNAHVHGNELYLANYTEGIRILDISDPGHPAEFAYADSYLGPSGNFNGVWDVSPYYPSGTVIASDRQGGLFVYRPVRNYGLVRVKVVDAATSQPLGGAKVFRGASVESLTTTADGVAVFAPDPGSHTWTTKLFGYYDASTTQPIAAGERDTITVAMVAKPSSHFMGVLRNAVTQAPLSDGEFNLAYTPVHAHTHPDGTFHLGNVPHDIYRIEIRCPGYIPAIYDRVFGPEQTSQTFYLLPARSHDALETDLGWSIGAAGDGASSGVWTRVEPIGTGGPQQGPGLRAGRSAPVATAFPRKPEGVGRFHEDHGEPAVAPGDIQPETDRTPPPGQLCFVTGQVADPPAINAADVDGGRTTLTSPRLDLTGMTVPTIGYWRWFYSGSREPDDWLAVLISNNDGVSWVVVDTTRGAHNHWREQAIRVADYVTPTNLVRLRFQAADFGNTSLVEAAVDDITVYDGANVPVAAQPTGAPARFSFRAPWPNPGSGAVRLALEVPNPGAVEVDVMDLQGRRVTVLFRGSALAGTLPLLWDGRDGAGREAKAGVYFARARAAGGETIARFVRVR